MWNWKVYSLIFVFWSLDQVLLFVVMLVNFNQCVYYYIGIDKSSNNLDICEFVFFMLELSWDMICVGIWRFLGQREQFGKKKKPCKKINSDFNLII
jgi:hypothetical protein